MNGSDGTGEAAEIRRIVTIANQRGLHARAAAKFVKCAERFDAEISVVRQDTVVSGLSIMGLMMLAATSGSDIELRARGPEAAAAITAIVRLIDEKFHED